MKEATKEKIYKAFLWIVVIGLTVFGTWLFSKVIPATTVEKRTAPVELH